MHSLEELKFAQKYPLTSQAKNIVRESNLSLQEIPEEILYRARALIAAAYEGKDYSPKITQSTELLKNEILAFPAAKILLSCTGRSTLYPKFADSFAKTTFAHLEKEKTETLFDIATDLGLPYNESENKNFIAEMNVLDFLKVDFTQEFMKLVNLNVSDGKVLLTRNDFVRFISEIARKKVEDSLPVDTKNIPYNLKNYGKQLASTLSEFHAKQFSHISLGKVKVDAFPPCIDKIYQDLLKGKNVNHIARFDLASFMIGIGMPAQDVIGLFKSTPNWNEQKTRYHVENIAGKKGTGTRYSPASCSKMREHGLRLTNCPCVTSSLKHPLQFYRDEVQRILKTEKKDKLVTTSS